MKIILTVKILDRKNQIDRETFLPWKSYSPWKTFYGENPTDHEKFLTVKIILTVKSFYRENNTDREKLFTVKILLTVKYFNRENHIDREKISQWESHWPWILGPIYGLQISERVIKSPFAVCVSWWDYEKHSSSFDCEVISISALAFPVWRKSQLREK